MTKLQIAIPGLFAMSLERDDEPSPPSYDADADGEEVSQVVSAARSGPGLAKATLRGAYELPRRKVAR